MEKEKILKESKKDQTVNDKGVVSSSLLGCPFPCKSKPRLCVIGFTLEKETLYSVQCHGQKGTRYRITTGWYRTIKKAVEKWNNQTA